MFHVHHMERLSMHRFFSSIIFIENIAIENKLTPTQ